MVDDVRRRPQNIVMAGFAIVSRRDMRPVLASRRRAVMAIDAVARDVHVIEIGRDPRRRRMTVVAGIAARNMIGRLAGRRGSIVAGRACSQYLRMVHSVGRYPQDVVMAILTHVGRGDMRWRFAARIRPVVACYAVAEDICVIEISRDPGNRRVTVVAVVTTVDVSRMFPCCGCAVVAGRARSQYLRVVN